MKNFRLKTLQEIGLKKAEKVDTRLCEVDGEPAFFHRWVVEEKALLKLNSFVPTSALRDLRDRFDRLGIVQPYGDIEKISNTFALVEMPDGSVKKVEPEKVRFIERKEAE